MWCREGLGKGRAGSLEKAVDGTGERGKDTHNREHDFARVVDGYAEGFEDFDLWIVASMRRQLVVTVVNLC